MLFRSVIRPLGGVGHLSRKQVQVLPLRRYVQVKANDAVDVAHSRFLSEAKPGSDFELEAEVTEKDHNALEQEAKDFSPWTGRLSPTTSHLFKLLLPLPASLVNTAETDARPTTTAFLLHPSQPLSHLSRLITGSLPLTERNADIEYMALTGKDDHVPGGKPGELDPDEEHSEGGPIQSDREKGQGEKQMVRWSQSTDLGDFIKQSTLDENFRIVISPEPKEGVKPRQLEITILIPSFASRTVYLRKRLLKITKELDKLNAQKKQIDHEAHRGARRLAVGGLVGLAVYWGAVFRLTFYSQYGWDAMEPITYLVGLFTIGCGYAFFLYHNREVSYSSILDMSVSSRQQALYRKHGLDIAHWSDTVAEAKTLRGEIARIAADYDLEWKGQLENLDKSFQRTASPRAKAAGFTAAKSNTAEERPDQKLDINKTIDEAAEMEAQSREKRERERKQARRGGAPEDEEEKIGKEEERGKKVDSK